MRKLVNWAEERPTSNKAPEETTVPTLFLPDKEEVILRIVFATALLSVAHFVKLFGGRYYQCSDTDDCPLCKLGMGQIPFHFFPVWVPELTSMRVLRVSAKEYPGALLPQIERFFKGNAMATPPISVVRMSRTRYIVRKPEPDPKWVAGDEEIRAFIEAVNEKSVDLDTNPVITELELDELRRNPEIKV